MIFKDLSRRHIFLLTIAPVMVSIFFRDFFIGDVTRGWLDEWCNTGFFLHYADPTYSGCSYYKISRLSWIIPGFLIFKVFSPVPATLILHIGSIVLTGIFLYLMIAMITEKHISFWVALFSEFYAPLQGMGGWDYQNLPSGIFYSMTLLFLTKAAYSSSKIRNLFISGCCFFATLFSVIQFVNMLPIIVLYYVFLSKENISLRKYLSYFSFFLIGGISLTLALCFINFFIGRQFLFFMPMLDLVIRMVHDSSTQKYWWQPLTSGWVSQAVGSYLLLPTGTFLACLVYVIREFSRMRKKVVLSDIMVMQFFLSFLLWVAWQSVGQTALQPAYFSYPLYIPMMIALAGLLIGKDFNDNSLEKRNMYGFYKDIAVVIAFLGVLLMWKVKIFQVFNSKIATVINLHPWAVLILLTSTLLLLRLRYLTYVLPLVFSFFMVGYLIIQDSKFNQDSFGGDFSITECHRSELFDAQVEMGDSLSKFSTEALIGVLWDPKVVMTSKNLSQSCSFNLSNYLVGFVELAGHWFSFAPWDKHFLDNSNPQKIPDMYYLSQANQTVGVIAPNPLYAAKVLARFHEVGRIKMHVAEHLVFITSYGPIYFDVITDSPVIVKM